MNNIQTRVHTLDTFWRGYTEMIRPSPEQRESMRSKRLDKSFVEQIELIISRVNGCRTCTYVHSANSLQEGLSDKELEELLALADERCVERKSLLVPDGVCDPEISRLVDSPQQVDK